jgi:hypothetical protein
MSNYCLKFKVIGKLSENLFNFINGEIKKKKFILLFLIISKIYEFFLINLILTIFIFNLA